jgi:HD-like signal output (HDOD) protein
MPDRTLLSPFEETGPSELEPQPDTALIRVKLCNLPPFHDAAKHVLCLKDRHDLDTRRIARIVGSDPALAAEVLFLANSSLFGFPSRIQVLNHAVALLGLDRVTALAVTVATRALLGQGGPLADQCWRHSAASAIIAAEFAEPFGISKDGAYTAALLHDVGRLGLLKSYPLEYGVVLGTEYQSLEAVLEAERTLFQVDHSDAGAWLAGYWAFPASFIEVCERHHRRRRKKDSPLLHVVSAACAVADAFGYSAVRYKNSPGYRYVVGRLDPEIARLLPLEEQLRSDVQTRISALAN